MASMHGWLILALYLSGISLDAGLSAAIGDEFRWYEAYSNRTWVLRSVENEILVQFSREADRVSRDHVSSSLGLTSIHPFDQGHRTAVYRISDSNRVSGSASILDRLLDSPTVEVAVHAVRDHEGFTKYYLPGQVTIQFDPRLRETAILERIHASGSVVLQDYWTPGYYRVRIPDSRDTFDQIRRWSGSPDVLFAEPFYICYDDPARAPQSDPAPSDPLFTDQWALDNPGTGDWLESADVSALRAWEVTRGDPGVLIVTIDTGADIAHEDLVDRLIPRDGDDWDFSSEESEEPWDELAHGTACAGIAVASQNGLGISGICPECSWMPLKVSLQGGDNANRADAINYAVSRRPEFIAVILSCSWVMSSGDFTAVRAAFENAWASDCLIFCASGNYSTDPVRYPARYPECVAVGATSPCDELTGQNSCDGLQWGSNFGEDQEVVAPGVLIHTTDITGEDGYSDGNYFTPFSGTSAATPLVAGVAGLVYSAAPGLTAKEVRERIRRTAEDQVGPPDQDLPGRDRYFGFGRVHAYRAVADLATGLSPARDRALPAEPGWSSVPAATYSGSDSDRVVHESIGRAVPNPFVSRTEIRFSIRQPSGARLIILDTTGRRLVDRPLGRLDAGEHQVNWDGRSDGKSLPTGIYLYRIELNRADVTATLVSGRVLRIR